MKVIIIYAFFFLAITRSNAQDIDQVNEVACQGYRFALELQFDRIYPEAKKIGDSLILEMSNEQKKLLTKAIRSFSQEQILALKEYAEISKITKVPEVQPLYILSYEVDSLNDYQAVKTQAILNKSLKKLRDQLTPIPESDITRTQVDQGYYSGFTSSDNPSSVPNQHDFHGQSLEVTADSLTTCSLIRRDANTVKGYSCLTANITVDTAGKIVVTYDDPVVATSVYGFGDGTYDRDDFISYRLPRLCQKPKTDEDSEGHLTSDRNSAEEEVPSESQSVPEEEAEIQAQ